MSVIQNIRNRYAKVAGFVIALALVGFILMDAGSSRIRELFSDDNSVAKVNGNKIELKDYYERTEEYNTLYSQGQSLDEATKAQINEQAINDLISESIIKEESEKLGLQTTEGEKKDIIYGVNPDPSVQNFYAFKNPQTNMFDPQMVKLFEENVDYNNQEYVQAYQQWMTLKSYILRNTLSRKYNALLTQAVYVPNFIMEKQMKEQNMYASVNYVNVPYSTITDEQVKVTDEDLNNYIKEHKAQYYIDEPTVSVEYVSFDVSPSKEDTARKQNAIADIKQKFEETDDAFLFAKSNSDESEDTAYIAKNNFMSAYSDSIMSLSKGEVFGPYYENGYYKLSRLVDRTVYPDSVVCRHILVKTQDRGQQVLSDSAAKLKIDSAIAAIKSGMPFADAVTKYSDDEGSQTTGGEYTFTLQQKANISKEFADFIFDGKKGEKTTVQVANGGYAGYHYIEILDQKAFQPAVKVATISKKLDASQQTINNAYSKALEFASKNKTAKDFDAAVQNSKLEKRLADNIKATSFVIPGLGPSRPLVRWTNNAEKGDVSEVFDLGDRYIVAKVSDKQKEGLMQLDDNIKPAIQEQVTKDKKAKMIMDKYNSSKSLPDIAAVANSTVLSADSFNASTPFVANLGYEPKVVGYAFSKEIKKDQASPGIEGDGGVYYISLKDKFTKDVPVDSNVMMQQKNMNEMQAKNAIGSVIPQILKKSAEIKYSKRVP